MPVNVKIDMSSLEWDLYCLIYVAGSITYKTVQMGAKEVSYFPLFMLIR